MANLRFEFSEADLDKLGAKLDSLGDTLSEQDRKILLAAFKLAGDQLQKRVAGEEPGVSSFSWSRGGAAIARTPSTSIRDGLRNGFFDSFRNRNLGGRPVAIDDTIRDSVDI